MKFKTLVIKESVIQGVGPPPGRCPTEEIDNLMKSRKGNSTNSLVIYPEQKSHNIPPSFYCISTLYTNSSFFSSDLMKKGKENSLRKTPQEKLII